ncbi:MAG: hypothetical protein ABH824_06500 [Nanoarchaeota archaeon]
MMKKIMMLFVLIVLVTSVIAQEDIYDGEDSCAGFWGSVNCFLWGDSSARAGKGASGGETVQQPPGIPKGAQYWIKKEDGSILYYKFEGGVIKNVDGIKKYSQKYYSTGEFFEGINAQATKEKQSITYGTIKNNDLLISAEIDNGGEPNYANKGKKFSPPPTETAPTASTPATSPPLIPPATPPTTAPAASAVKKKLEGKTLEGLQGQAVKEEPKIDVKKYVSKDNIQGYAYDKVEIGDTTYGERAKGQGVTFDDLRSNIKLNENEKQKVVAEATNLKAELDAAKNEKANLLAQQISSTQIFTNEDQAALTAADDKVKKLDDEINDNNQKRSTLDSKIRQANDLISEAVKKRNQDVNNEAAKREEEMRKLMDKVPPIDLSKISKDDPNKALYNQYNSQQAGVNVYRIASQESDKKYLDLLKEFGPKDHRTIMAKVDRDKVRAAWENSVKTLESTTKKVMGSAPDFNPFTVLASTPTSLYSADWSKFEPGSAAQKAVVGALDMDYDKFLKDNAQKIGDTKYSVDAEGNVYYNSEIKYDVTKPNENMGFKNLIENYDEVIAAAAKKGADKLAEEQKKLKEADETEAEEQKKKAAAENPSKQVAKKLMTPSQAYDFYKEEQDYWEKQEEDLLKPRDDAKAALDKQLKESNIDDYKTCWKDGCKDKFVKWKKAYDNWKEAQDNNKKAEKKADALRWQGTFLDGISGWKDNTAAVAIREGFAAFENIIGTTSAYQALSNALFPELQGGFIDWNNERWANTWADMPSFMATNANADKDCRADDVKRREEPGKGYAFVRTAGGTYQFVGSIQAEKSAKPSEILCEANPDQEAEEGFICGKNLVCKDDQFCYENEDDQEPAKGYFYKITWGVTAPQDEKFTPYINEDGVAIKFNVYLDGVKPIFSRLGFDDKEAIQLTNGARDGGTIIRYLKEGYNRVCIKFTPEGSVEDYYGDVVDEICATFKTSEKGKVEYIDASSTNTAQTAYSSSPEVTMNI